MHEFWPHLVSFPRFLDPLNWFWLSTKGYAFTSSGLQLSVPAGIVLWWRKHNCHAHWCWRLAKHSVDGTPYMVCRKHHPTIPGKVTAEHIARAHASAHEPS